MTLASPGVNLVDSMNTSLLSNQFKAIMSPSCVVAYLMVPLGDFFGMCSSLAGKNFRLGMHVPIALSPLFSSSRNSVGEVKKRSVAIMEPTGNPPTESTHSRTADVAKFLVGFAGPFTSIRVHTIKVACAAVVEAPRFHSVFVWLHGHVNSHMTAMATANHAFVYVVERAPSHILLEIVVELSRNHAQFAQLVVTWGTRRDQYVIVGKV